ncbi:hypothetical protein QUF76_02575 [Desulfobacterales bacterium HSG16]|nr:hypothetical protein [Desulfobacterales bacterium HSG16]
MIGNKSVSFDAMVKYFIKKYNIPTKKDMDSLNKRLDHIEYLILNHFGQAEEKAPEKKKAGNAVKTRQNNMSASDIVYNVIKSFKKKGVGFAEIQDRTNFEEKKLRNIIFRLNDIGRIERKKRGIYIAA